jgi:hypothetical protein
MLWFNGVQSEEKGIRLWPESQDPTGSQTGKNGAATLIELYRFSPFKSSVTGEAAWILTKLKIKNKNSPKEKRLCPKKFYKSISPSASQKLSTRRPICPTPAYRRYSRLTLENLAHE